MFHCYYDIDELIQIPGIQYLFYGKTWEKGGYDARYMGVMNESGRLMVMINYNVDLGDAWEWAEVEEYPRKYANLAFQLGINYIVYAMDALIPAAAPGVKGEATGASRRPPGLTRSLSPGTRRSGGEAIGEADVELPMVQSSACRQNRAGALLLGRRAGKTVIGDSRYPVPNPRKRRLHGGSR